VIAHKEEKAGYRQYFQRENAENLEAKALAVHIAVNALQIFGLAPISGNLSALSIARSRPGSKHKKRRRLHLATCAAN